MKLYIEYNEKYNTYKIHKTKFHNAAPGSQVKEALVKNLNNSVLEAVYSAEGTNFADVDQRLGEILWTHATEEENIQALLAKYEDD
jgi:hypothetical protein